MQLLKKKPAKQTPPAPESATPATDPQPPVVQPVKVSASGFDFPAAAKAANLDPIQPDNGEDLADAFERMMAPATQPLADGFKKLREESRKIMPDWARFPSTVLKKAREGKMPKDLELEGVVDLATASGWIQTRKQRARKARQVITQKELEPAIVPVLEARIAAATELHAQARQDEETFFSGFGIAEAPQTAVSAATGALLADSEGLLESFHHSREFPQKDAWSTISNRLLQRQSA
jgi:hypothetical protein